MGMGSKHTLSIFISGKIKILQRNENFMLTDDLQTIIIPHSGQHDIFNQYHTHFSNETPIGSY